MARVLHLITSDHRRGAETFAVELAEHLRRAGHDVRVMAVARSGSHDPLPVEHAGRSRTDPAALRRIVGAARWSDVVVSFGSSSVLPAAAAARLTRRPFVYRNIGDPTVWGAVKAGNLRVGAPLRTAQVVVALYQEAAAALVGSYRLDPARVRVIPRGVPQDAFEPADAAARRRSCDVLGLDPARRWMAYVGALSAEKDPMLAVETLGHLPEDVGLVIAGDGPLGDEVRTRATRFGDRCRLLGTVRDVAGVYAASSALILPSHTEGIPGAVIEAGLAARPTVAFPVGGVPGVVLDGITGRLVGDRTPSAVAAAIAEVLERPDELGRAAREHCLAGFSMTRVGAAWEQVITDVTADGPAPGPRRP